VVCSPVIAIEFLPEVQMTQSITCKHYDEMITKILKCKSYNDSTSTNQESNQLVRKKIGSWSINDSTPLNRCSTPAKEVNSSRFDNPQSLQSTKSCFNCWRTCFYFSCYLSERLSAILHQCFDYQNICVVKFSIQRDLYQ
jgi:hypothetical protein